MFIEEKIQEKIDNLEDDADCVKVLDYIRDEIGTTGEESHHFADKAILKLLEVLGYQHVVDAYWNSSDYFWYA